MDGLSIPILAFAPVDPNAATDGTIGGLIFYMAIALGVSFLCSVLEAAILSTGFSYVEMQVKTGKRSALIMQKLKQNVELPISAILTLNTFAHTIGAAGAGAQATAVFGNEWFGLISAVLTLLILVFSEIIPKTIGAVYWKQLFVFTAYTTQVMLLILYPAVWIFQWMTKAMRPLEEQPTVTRSELEAMAQLSAEEGTLLEKENLILRNLLHLQNVQVKDIMTPRTVVMALQQDWTVEKVMSTHPVLPYSRIPIYNENTDDIVAYVLRHNIFRYAAQDEHDKKLKAFSRQIHAIPETNSVAQVLDEFIAKREHIFLVFDEYGGTAGIITLEDTIESLLGIEITDESDIVEDLRQLAQQRFQRQSALLNQMEAATDMLNGNKPSLPVEADDNPETEPVDQ